MWERLWLGELLWLRGDHLKLEEGMSDLLLDAQAQGVEERKGFVFEFEEGIFLPYRAEVDLGAQMIDVQQVFLPEFVDIADEEAADHFL